MDLGLAGKRVWLTGASAGIGAACARLFAAEGARMLLMARREELLHELAAELRSLGAPEVLVCAGSVEELPDLERAVSLAQAEWGGLDALVYNAGGPPAGGFAECSDAAWQTGYERTLLGFVRAVRLVVPEMVEQRYGRVVNISSVAARQPIDNLVISNTLRAGLLGLVRTLANSYGAAGLTFHNVLPGFTSTDRLRSLATHSAAASGESIDAVFERWSRSAPAQRIAEPEEVARVVVFLASDGASFMNGGDVAVDGGQARGV